MSRTHVLPTALAVIALTAVAAALRWPTLAGSSFWFDEWVTRSLVRRSLFDVIRDVKGTESTPPLYYVLAWGWGHLFGTSEFALRSLSGVFGAATVPVAYAAGATLASREAGVIAASFVAFNPLLVWYSTEARAYSLLVLLSALTVWFMAWSLSDPGRRGLALWSLSSCLALTTHYFAVLLIAAEAVVLLALLPVRRRSCAVAFCPVVVIGLALAPLAYLQRDHTRWIAALPLDGRVREIPRNFAAGISAPTVWLEVAVALVAFAALILLILGDRRERRAAAVGLSVGALSLTLALVLALVRDYVLTRNVLIAWFPLALVVAVACGVRRARVAGPLLAASLCAVWLAGVVAIASSDDLQRVDWRRAARLLGPAERDRLVFAWGDYRTAPLGDELVGARKLRPGGVANVAELDLLGFDRPVGRISCWSGSACNMRDIHPVPGVAPPGFVFVARRSDGLFEVLHFRASRRVRVTWRAASTLYPRYGPPTAWVQLRPPGARRDDARG